MLEIIFFDILLTG